MPTTEQRELSLASSGVSHRFGIYNKDNVCVQITWTGAPAGSFYIQVSLDDISYADLAVDAVPAGGSPGSWVYDLNQLSMTYLRVRYDRTSGTGVATILLGGKKV